MEENILYSIFKEENTNDQENIFKPPGLGQFKIAAENLILQRRYSDRSLSAVLLVDPGTFYRLCPIPATAQPLVQIEKVLHQLLGVLSCRDLVDPGRLAFTQLPKRLFQQMDVDSMGQRGEDHLRVVLGHSADLQ